MYPASDGLTEWLSTVRVRLFPSVNTLMRLETTCISKWWATFCTLWLPSAWTRICLMRLPIDGMTFYSRSRCTVLPQCEHAYALRADQNAWMISTVRAGVWFSLQCETCWWIERLPAFSERWATFCALIWHSSAWTRICLREYWIEKMTFYSQSRCMVLPQCEHAYVSWAPGLTEWLLTVEAGVWPFPSVNTLMQCERTSPAWMTFHSQRKSMAFPQCEHAYALWDHQPAEWLSTVSARAWFFPSVNTLMLCERTRMPEWLSTVCASVRLSPVWNVYALTAD